MNVHRGYLCDKCDRPFITLNDKKKNELFQFNHDLCGYEQIECCKNPQGLSLCTDCITVFLNMQYKKTYCMCDRFKELKLYECVWCNSIFTCDQRFSGKNKIYIIDTNSINIYFDSNNVPICGFCAHKTSSRIIFNKNIPKGCLKLKPI